MSEEGEVLIHHLEVKKTLDLLRALCKGKSSPIMEACRDFNRATEDGRKMDFYSGLLQEAIRSIIRVKEESDLVSLFSAGGTTALLNAIKGIEDFELIAFVVIRRVNA